jgi:hypothetical protein
MPHPEHLYPEHPVLTVERNDIGTYVVVSPDPFGVTYVTPGAHAALAAGHDGFLVDVSAQGVLTITKFDPTLSHGGVGPDAHVLFSGVLNPAQIVGAPPATPYSAYEECVSGLAIGSDDHVYSTSTLMLFLPGPFPLPDPTTGSTGSLTITSAGGISQTGMIAFASSPTDLIGHDSVVPSPLGAGYSVSGHGVITPPVLDPQAHA